MSGTGRMNAIGKQERVIGASSISERIARANSAAGGRTDYARSAWAAGNAGHIGKAIQARVCDDLIDQSKGINRDNAVTTSQAGIQRGVVANGSQIERC